ncbi:MAG: hypothetical protein ABJE47_22705 [bacterium]
MAGITDSPRASFFPLVESRAKAITLLAVIITGRVLRDLIVPPGNQPMRSVYTGALIGVVLFLLARTGMPRSRAVLWSVVAGIATTAVMAL